MKNFLSSLYESSSRFAKVYVGSNELNIHYNDLGQGDRVVLMIHGSGPGTSGWINFKYNVEPLLNSGFRVLLMDCPGWGKSSSIVCSESRPMLNAKAAKGLVDALSIEKVYLVGNSLGAHSCVMFSLEFPSRVVKMILMGGGTRVLSSFVPMPTEGIKALMDVYKNPSLETLRKMIEVFVFDPSSFIDEDSLKSRLDNLMSRPDHIANFIKSFEVNPNQYPDVSSRLAEILIPTLIFWGRDDRVLPLDAGLRLVAGIPNSELRIINRCGHWVQIEHKEMFNRAIVDYFSN